MGAGSCRPVWGGAFDAPHVVFVRRVWGQRSSWTRLTLLHQTLMVVAAPFGPLTRNTLQFVVLPQTALAVALGRQMRRSVWVGTDRGAGLKRRLCREASREA